MAKTSLISSLLSGVQTSYDDYMEQMRAWEHDDPESYHNFIVNQMEV